MVPVGGRRAGAPGSLVAARRHHPAAFSLGLPSTRPHDHAMAAVTSLVTGRSGGQLKHGATPA